MSGLSVPGHGVWFECPRAWCLLRVSQGIVSGLSVPGHSLVWMLQDIIWFECPSGSVVWMPQGTMSGVGALGVVSGLGAPGHGTWSWCQRG